jgi:hypothetical protein
MSETQTPDAERREHQQAILSTIPQPLYEQVLSTKMILPEGGANTFDGASQKRVELYRTFWSDALAHPVILVKRRNSISYEVVDGRHRFLARKGKPFLFHALVFHELNVPQEAALFWYFNAERRTPNAAEKHTAGLFAGDPVAQVVDSVLVEHALRNRIKAYGTLHRIVRRSESLAAGRATIEFAIRALTDCFPTDEKRYEAVLLSGFARFYQLHGGDSRLVYEELVQRVHSAGLIAAQVVTRAVSEARTSGQGAEHRVVDQLAKAWNRGQTGGYKIKG